MMTLRAGDKILVAATVVESIDGTVRFMIDGKEATAPVDEVSVTSRAFHVNDPVTLDGEEATIMQTLEEGVHMLRLPKRKGVEAYRVVEESSIQHAKVAADKAPETKDGQADDDNGRDHSDAAADLASSLGGGGIDLESLGDTRSYKPVGEHQNG